MAKNRKTDAERQAESKRILEGVARDSETIGASSTRRAANRARDHFAGADADADDRIEIWGRRIGRFLSLLFFIALVIYLAVTYL